MNAAAQTSSWLDEFRAVRRNVEAAHGLRRGGRPALVNGAARPQHALAGIGGLGSPVELHLTGRTITGGQDEERRRRLVPLPGRGSSGPSNARSASWSDRQPARPDGGGGADALGRARQLAAGYQPAVVKVVSYAYGVARATATAQYVQREEVALETHDGRTLADGDAVADEIKAWSTGFARRAESQDVVSLRLTLHGVRDTPEGRDLYARAIAAGLDGHRHALRLDALPTGSLEARLVVVMAGPAKERFRLRDCRVGAGESSFVERRLDASSEAAVKARIGVATDFPAHAISLVPGATNHGRDGVVRRLERLIAVSPAQDDQGRFVANAGDARRVAQEWAPGLLSQSARDTMHLILSARAGTDSTALAATARAFLHDCFGDHKFLFGLHTDMEAEGHIHVHAIVAVRNEAGRKIHPGRETFRGWREAYAHHAQAEGLRIVATTACERAASQSYGARDKIIVDLAERPRSTRHAKDRAYAEAPDKQTLLAAARDRIAAARANPIRIPRSSPDREATTTARAAWQHVADEQPGNPVARSFLARLTLAETLGGIVHVIGRRVEHLTKEQHGMAVTSEQMAKDLRAMDEAVSRTGDLLDGPTKQRFEEASARYLETLANRLELERARENGAQELTRPEIEALVGPSADQLLERARSVRETEAASARSARQIADRASDAERREEGRGGRDPEAQRELAAQRAIVRTSRQTAERETREATAAAEVVRVVADHPVEPLSAGLVRTDALAQLKDEQTRLMREIEAERPQAIKGQRMT